MVPCWANTARRSTAGARRSPEKSQAHLRFGQAHGGAGRSLLPGHMGVDVVVLRFATTYGPGKTARHGKMGVTSQIVENPFNGLPFRLAQGGDEKDDFIYNKDSAHGIYLACTAEIPTAAFYNIGTRAVGVTLKRYRARHPQASAARRQSKSDPG